MTNTPTSATGIRIPQYALTLAVILLALGALLAASQGINERAFVRAEFTATPAPTLPPSPTPVPIDPFANLTFTTWTSEGNLISMEVPALWTPQPARNSPIAYTFTAEGTPSVGIGIFVIPTAELGIPGVAPDASPETILKAAFASDPSLTVREVQAGALKGAAVKQSEVGTDPATGALSGTDSDIWLLAIDANHVLLLQAIAPTERWAEMEPILARATSSLTLDVAATIARMTSVSGTPVPAPTAEATATQQSESAPTAEATAEVTAAPTAEATAEPAGPVLPTATPAN